MMNLDNNLQLASSKQGDLNPTKLLSLRKFNHESQSTSSENENNAAKSPYAMVWDIENSSPIITVFNHGKTARRRKCKDSTDLVRTCQPLTAGVHVIQFKFNEKPWGSHCAVGLVTKGARFHADEYCHLMGQDENSWCLDIPSRKVMHNGSLRPGYSMPSKEEEIDREISMIVNTKKGTVAFVVNKKSLGIAYTNLGRYDLYPAVSLVYGRQEVTIEDSVAPFDDEESPAEDSTDTDSNFPHPSGDNTPEPTGDYVTLVEVSELPAEQQTILQVAHGWNEKRMGEKLCGVMPNAPNVCYPPKPTFSVSFPYRQQAVVARRGFSKGCYVWQITEDVINHFLMRGGPENMPMKQNDVIIGVATGEFDNFMDAGIPLRWEFGPNFWGWKVSASTLVFRRRRRSHRYPVTPVKIDLKRGVEVILDCEARTLSYAFRDQNLGIAFRSLPDCELFPAIIFDGHSWFPVRLELSQAPQQYLEDFIAEAETASLDKDDYLELIGFCTLDEVAKRDDQVEAPRIVRSKFGWFLDDQLQEVVAQFKESGSVFHTIKVNDDARSNPSDPLDVVVFSEFGLMYTGRHVIYFNIPDLRPKEHYRIGFVDSTYVELWTELHSRREEPMNPAQECIIKEVMLNHYWAWDMLEHKLYHAGKKMCNYPVVGFHAWKFKHYQLVVDIRKVITVSLFAADSQTGDDLDLGVMVTNLTDRRPIFPMVHFLHGQSACTILYMEGPKAYVNEFSRVQSGSCSVL